MDVNPRTLRRLVLLGVLVVAAGVYYSISPASGAEADSWAARSAFGDWVAGGVSALALLGVVVTIILQTEELGLQREELRETRRELQGAKEAQLKQAELLALSAEAQHRFAESLEQLEGIVRTAGPVIKEAVEAGKRLPSILEELKHAEVVAAQRTGQTANALAALGTQAERAATISSLATELSTIEACIRDTERGRTVSLAVDLRALREQRMHELMRLRSGD